MTENTAIHMANIIKKAYSPIALELVAIEMGEEIIAGKDIFETLIQAGRASDLETAVTLVACHLDGLDSTFDTIPGFLRKDRRRAAPSKA